MKLQQESLYLQMLGISTDSKIETVGSHVMLPLGKAIGLLERGFSLDERSRGLGFIT